MRDKAMHIDPTCRDISLMVMDQELVVRSVLKDVLETEEYTAGAAATGGEAGPLIQSSSYGCFLLNSRLNILARNPEAALNDTTIPVMGRPD